MTVQNKDGEDLGKVRNLVVDSQSGCLKYVVLATGGFLGLRSELRAVPPELVSAATAKRNVLATPLTKARWHRAPTSKRSELAGRTRWDHEQQITQYYQPEALEGADSAPRLSATGRAANQGNPVGPSQLQLATDLIGKTILDRNRAKLGEIRDLLVAFDSESPVLAVFSTGKLFRNQKNHYVVPLRQLNPTAKGNFILNTNLQRLSQARPFDELSWKTTTHPGAGLQIFSYAIND